MYIYLLKAQSPIQVMGFYVSKEEFFNTQQKIKNSTGKLKMLKKNFNNYSLYKLARYNLKIAIQIALLIQGEIG